MKKVASFLILLLFVCAGCNSAGQAQQEVEPAPSGQTEQASLPDAQPESETEAQDSITPYQFLYLIVGNAEDVSFSYSVYHHETKETETGAFYKSGDKSATVFSTKDMNGDAVTVRELEMDGYVHYIMEEARVIKSYLAPAEDYLVYEMMIAAKTVPDKALDQDGYVMYEYSLPFEQDESIKLRYGFYMKEGALKKLTYAMDDVIKSTFEFSEFTQAVQDQRVFEYPEGYHEEKFGYIYDGEHMPPWWEIGNDE